MVSNPSPTRSAVASISLVYDNARWVCRALDAIAAQHVMPDVHIVIDDGSHDDSAAVVRDYAARSSLPIHFVAHAANAGICARLNEALGLIPDGTEFVFFCSDDLLAPDHVERAVEALRRTPDAVGYFCAMEVVDGAGAHLEWKHLAPGVAGPGDNEQVVLSGARMTELLFGGNVIGAPTVVMRWSALQRAGRYDERFMLEDYEMWFRLSAMGSWIYDDHVSVQYVVHGANTTSRRAVAMKLATANVLLKHVARARGVTDRASAARQVADNAVDAAVTSARRRNWAVVRESMQTLGRGALAFRGRTSPTYLSRVARSLLWTIRRELRAAP